ncbi:TolC family protein [Paraburkholderia megapolitana]|uniref:Protein CyaE n=1 Tax=Paraburkholderia megapolitana TaxID=420953 RepID=A0A1I3ERR8_9BURK|nr:TolC family protein [Paraburkholderia megapolitana]QDQ80237.1 TolC family protein [Paraburkholderia megapolitana]SFI01550.1 outer membrane protein [Paraburkholderia megapolitana]
MSTRLLLTSGVVFLFLAQTASAQWVDIYGTKQTVSGSPAGPLLMNESCLPETTDRALGLQDVLLQAICVNPQARQAWADVRAQAAAVGVSEAAYLPTLDATAGVERDTLATTYNASAIGAGSISSSQNSSSRYGTLNFGWVLFDFGKRNADLRQARQLLAAANATQDDVLQTIFFSAAQAYYDLSDAQTSLEAARATEGIAHDSLVDATEKHNGGVGALSDQLQAETTYRRAVLDRVSAEGDVSSATGTLASVMGLDANTPVKISAAQSEPDNPAFAQDVNLLIDEAKSQHPKLVAARARLEAARANVDSVRAEGRPTVSLVGDLTQNNPSYQQQPEQFPITGSRGSTIGIQLKIPLFEGFASGYRVEQAERQADAEEASLQNTKLQVSLNVWKSYEDLLTGTTNLGISKDLLAAAERSLEITRGRYREGVGTFTELLNSQAALTDARKQRVLAISKWRTSRLRLALSLGNLGFWSR